MPYENKIALERAHSAIIVDNYKLIKFYDNNDIKLYDIKNDISESIDLSKIHMNEKLTKKLEKILDKYLEEVKAPKWQPKGRQEQLKSGKEQPNSGPRTTQSDPRSAKSDPR